MATIPIEMTAPAATARLGHRRLLPLPSGTHLQAAAAGGLLLLLAAVRAPVGAPVLAVGLGWPVLVALVAGQEPRLGSPVTHRRRAAARATAVATFAWCAASTVWSGTPAAGLLLSVVLAHAVLVAATPLARRTGRPRRVLVVAGPAHLPVAMAHAAVMNDGRAEVVGGCTAPEAAAALATERPDALLAVPGSGLTGRDLQRLTWHAEAADVPLVLLTGLTDVAAQRTRHLDLGRLGALEVRPARRCGSCAAVKAVWEPVAALLALVVLAPLLLILVVWIRLDSPGPALFRQTRVGRDGRPFTMLKLRTMHVGAESVRATLANEADAVLFKVRRDPRVTRAGRVLRRYSLDELPQLVNVLRGEMALVGPRPALPAEVASYEEDPRRRLVVRPGLTGLWQVSGRSDLSWGESVRLDLDYVDNWSLLRDLAIVGRTVRAVLSHRGAY